MAMRSLSALFWGRGYSGEGWAAFLVKKPRIPLEDLRWYFSLSSSFFPFASSA